MRRCSFWFSYKIQIQILYFQVSPGLTQLVNRVALTTFWLICLFITDLNVNSFGSNVGCLAIFNLCTKKFFYKESSLLWKSNVEPYDWLGYHMSVKFVLTLTNLTMLKWKPRGCLKLFYFFDIIYKFRASQGIIIVYQRWWLVGKLW